MSPIAILYATREGQTRRIAEHIAATIRGRGLDAVVHCVAHLPEGFDVASSAAVVLAASIHVGRHEAEMISFVKSHLDALRAMPTAFLSVSLTEATAEDPHKDEAARAQAHAAVAKCINDFFDETGFLPDYSRPVAGALLYTQYGFFKRFLMKMIARSAGGDTDTSRDHEYTDWTALDQFVDRLAQDLPLAKSMA